MNHWADDSKSARQNQQWTAHQKIVQQCASKDSSVMLLPPLIAFPIPRWINKVEKQMAGRVVVFGTWLPSFQDIQEMSVVLNIHDGLWNSDQADVVFDWWRQLPVNQSVVTTAESLLQVKREIADLILSCSQHMLSWGVQAAVAFRILAKSLDLLEQQRFHRRHLVPDKRSLMAVVLLQAAAKYHWLSDAMTGSVSSLSFFCKALHKHFNIDLAHGECGVSCTTSSVFQVDQLYLNELQHVDDE